MSELDSRCKALLKAGRLGDEPSFEDEDRVHRALASRIAAAAVVGAAVGVGAKVGVAAAAGKAAKVAVVVATGSAGASAVGTTTAVASGFMLKLIGIGMLAGVATVGVVTMVPSGDSGKARVVTTEIPTVQTSHVGVVSEPAIVGVATEASVRPEVQEAAPVMNQPTKPAVSAVSSAVVSTLDEEMQLIRSAQRELHSGKASTALGILAEHARRFPRGSMSEDRVALQVLALCASGRGADARTQAAKFMASHPRSPYAGPVSSCAGIASPGVPE